MAVVIQWKMDEYVNRSTSFRPSDQPAASQCRLANDFPNPHFGLVDRPATLVSSEGEIIAWHLPDVLNQVLQVRTITPYKTLELMVPLLQESSYYGNSKSRRAGDEGNRKHKGLEGVQ
jgi:hypothetical protein